MFGVLGAWPTWCFVWCTWSFVRPTQSSFGVVGVLFSVLGILFSSPSWVLLFGLYGLKPDIVEMLPMWDNEQQQRSIAVKLKNAKNANCWTQHNEKLYNQSMPHFHKCTTLRSFGRRQKV